MSITSARVTWTPGSGGTAQSIYIGSDKASVESNCASGGCAVADTTLSASQSSYTTGFVLTPGTTYYYRVVNNAGVGCATPSATVTNLLSCSLSPTSLSLSPSENSVITANVGASPDIERVDFASTNTAVASVSPLSDNTYPYTTTVTANTTGSATITATVYYTNGSVACQTGSASFPGSQNTSVTVANVTAWWQVQDGDVASSPPGTSA
ncbi:MAG: fibronectin type III domain-containing protein [Anaerolineales bacterium]|nr:fibronectin type III domain-containing protein [Anaerolineales bacterium]